MDKYIGKLLDDRYEILQIIGVGGMAVVYKAMDHRLNRLVAVKILKDDYLNDSEFRRRFHGESQAVAMMSHPNIVSVYDVSKSDNADYIVMELIDGITLKQYMEQKGGPLSWRETLHFAMQIARALEHAHSRNIIHRDIKPHNVMILKDGSVKVADFGIARVASAQNTLTKEALGSVHYISPEQARGARVDNRTDIYSLGVVMYEMLTGRPPYDGETPVSVAIQHINGSPLSPSLLNSEIPTGLEQITMHAMCADINIRYSSVSDMLKDMEEFRKNPAILFTFLPAGAAAEVAGVRPQMNRQSIVSSRQPQSSRTAQNGRQTRTNRGPQTSRNPQSDRRNQNAQTLLDDSREENGRKVLMWVGLALVLVALVAIVILLLHNANKKNTIPTSAPSEGETVEEQVTVPKFVGKKWSEVSHEPSDFQLVVYADYNPSFPYDEIFSQSVAPDERVNRGTVIELHYSLGVKTNIMPDVVNKDAEYIKTYLEDAFKVNVIPEWEDSDTVEEGFVIRTSPSAGEMIAEGQNVHVYISSGKKMVDVPGVVGALSDDAIAAIEAKELKATVEYEYSADVKEGRVISQSPQRGTTVEAGSSVTIVVSLGEKIVTVPDLVGKTKEEAIAALSALKLSYTVHEIADEHPAGEVIAQTPEPDTDAKEGDTVVLTVSSGPEENPEDPTEPTDPGNDPPGGEGESGNGG